MAVEALLPSMSGDCKRGAAPSGDESRVSDDMSTDFGDFILMVTRFVGGLDAAVSCSGSAEAVSRGSDIRGIEDLSADKVSQAPLPLSRRGRFRVE